MLSVLALVSYLLAGTHLGCADQFAVLHAEACVTTAACDEGGTHKPLAIGHCHAAHMHVVDASTPMLAQPVLTKTRPALPIGQIMASIDPSGPERPPRI